METQRFVQQNATTTTQSPSVGPPRTQSAVGKTRSGTASGGRFEVRVDPPQNHVPAPRSRAEQLTKFVAQFQAEQAGGNQGNVGADLAVGASTAAAAPMVNRAKLNPESVSENLSAQEHLKVEEAIHAIDRARRQFSHAAAMSRTPVDDIQSIKTPPPTATRAGIISTVSEAIAAEVNQPIDHHVKQESNQIVRPKAAPVAAIRQPFFARPSTTPTNARPEVVFEQAAAPLRQPVPANNETTLSANGLATDSPFETTWDTAALNPEPMNNLALRQTQDTDVVQLPESLLREIAEQHRQFEAEESANRAAGEVPIAQQPDALLANSVSHEITVDLAAWDVEAFRWPQVSDDILAHASPVMDQLTHYSLDILTGNENRVAVAGLKRGQGASTIAAAVARWAVANGKRVLLVDADLGNPHLSRTVGLSPNVSWLNLIREELIPSEAIIRSKSTGICIMPLAAVVTPQTWPGHLFDQLGGLLEQVRHGFDLILLDVGPVGQLSNELAEHGRLLDALMIVDENPSSGEFMNAKSRLLKSGIRKFIAAQNSVGTASI